MIMSVIRIKFKNNIIKKYGKKLYYNSKSMNKLGEVYE